MSSLNFKIEMLENESQCYTNFIKVICNDDVIYEEQVDALYDFDYEKAVLEINVGGLVPATNYKCLATVKNFFGESDAAVLEVTTKGMKLNLNI